MADVLVIDDEESVRVTLSEFLKDAGHAAGTAGDAAQAMAALESGDYDVVVCDIILPGTNGITLLGMIGERWPRIKVIVITGEPSAETMKEANRLGAFEYLTKPIKKNVIVDAVARAARREDAPLGNE